MRGRLFAVAIVLFVALVPGAASANVQVEIDVGSQTMEVYVDGDLRHTWKASTGRDGFETPGGEFSVKRMEEEWYSKEYDVAPMPHAIFFSGGFAIHGTYETKRLGRAASHGCVRLAPGNAARLYGLVERYGASRTHISIND